MKTSLLVASLLGVGAYAYPRMDSTVLAKMETLIEERGVDSKSLKRRASLSSTESNCGPTPCLDFDAASQLVSTTGQYAYASPAADEIRGPCPGLNAAANHGYLPRSGVATIPETITGLQQAYGMSPDVAVGLAAYAIVMDGDLLAQTWSIGGPQGADLLGDLLSPPQGISWSHNKYEGDTSIGRSDAYLNNGDAHSLNLTKFAQVYAIGMDDDRYTLDKFRIDSIRNQQDSVMNNPYYFAPLFSTTVVAPAAYNFVINFMSNHSAEEPSGYLNGDMFKTFFAVTGEYPNFEWLPGQERIPENWYRRPLSNQYTVPDVFEDLLIGWAAYPESFRFGGNVAGVNTYEGIELNNLTGGTYTSENIFEGDNFGCLFFQTQQQAVPDELKGLYSDLGAAAMSFLGKFIPSFFTELECPALAKYDSSLFNKYPGRTYSPTGPATNY